MPDTVYMQGVIGTMDLSKAEAVCRDLINLGTVAAASIKNASDFDSEMSRVKWIAGATDDEFETLRKKAIQLSAGTVLSASEYAAGMAAEILHDKTLLECLNTDLGITKLEQEKADLKRQLDSSATKLDAAVRQAKAAGADTDVAACRVYFTELQQTAAKVQELIGKINAKDPATGAKLSAAVISVLQSTAKNLEVAQ